MSEADLKKMTRRKPTRHSLLLSSRTAFLPQCTKTPGIMNSSDCFYPQCAQASLHSKSPSNTQQCYKRQHRRWLLWLLWLSGLTPSRKGQAYHNLLQDVCAFYFFASITEFFLALGDLVFMTCDTGQCCWFLLVPVPFIWGNS